MTIDPDTKGNAMTLSTQKEIDDAISRAAESGSLLNVAHMAMSIAAANGGQARMIAESLIAAGIKARIPMEIATPK